jgi:hypothetical protein
VLEQVNGKLKQNFKLQNSKEEIEERKRHVKKNLASDERPIHLEHSIVILRAYTTF